MLHRNQSNFWFYSKVIPSLIKYANLRISYMETRFAIISVLRALSPPPPRFLQKQIRALRKPREINIILKATSLFRSFLNLKKQQKKTNWLLFKFKRKPKSVNYKGRKSFKLLPVSTRIKFLVRRVHESYYPSSIGLTQPGFKKDENIGWL